MVAILIMVTRLHMVALSDRCFLATLGGAKILPQKTPVCAAWAIDFGYRPDSYLQSRFLVPGQNLGYNLSIAIKDDNG